MTRLALLALLFCSARVPLLAQSSEVAADSAVIDGVMRYWRLYVPPSYVAGAPTALVLNFHGSGSSPAAQEGLSGFERLADQEGFLVASPVAAYSLSSRQLASWNVDLEPGAVDDVTFIRELIRSVSSKYSVDASMVYATGMSGGGRMSSRLGCELADVIAAIGPVAGIQHPASCRPSRPIAVIAFHGRADSVNHYTHRPDSSPSWHMGVEDAVAGWATGAGCDMTAAAASVTPEVARLSYSGCRGGVEVVLYRSETAGHTWPGSSAAAIMLQRGLGKTDADILATRLIWDFFRKHPRQ